MFNQSLRSLPFFAGLEESDLDRLDTSVRHARFQAGEQIFGQGDPAQRLYMLLSGEVEIRFHPSDGDVLVVTVVLEGGVFGWSAALGRRSYTSGAHCTKSGEALWISGEALHDLCERHPQTGVVIIERLAEVIAGRLSNTRDAVAGMLHQGVGTGVKTA
jgi:CRP/FNR family cyclic AMP-dependent transcriptional regulator